MVLSWDREEENETLTERGRRHDTKREREKGVIYVLNFNNNLDMETPWKRDMCSE